MKIQYFYIFIIAFIQGGGYDFAGWYGIFKEQSGHKWEWLYRIIKETLDFIVTPAILIWVFHWNENLICAFYILKWFGWCDAFYIAMWKLFNPKKKYTEDGLWWLWWTPLGMSRSQVIYRRGVGQATTPTEAHLCGNWWFKKGVITLREFEVQLVIGLIVSYAVYHFEAVTFVWKLINQIIFKLILGLY